MGCAPQSRWLRLNGVLCFVRVAKPRAVGPVKWVFCAPEQVAPLNGVCWRMVCLVVTQGRGPVKWVRVLFLTPEQRAPLNGVVACVRAWTPWVGHVPKGILYILPATISFQCQRSLCTCLAFGRQQQFGHLASFSFCFDGNRGVDARNGGCAAA